MELSILNSKHERFLSFSWSTFTNCILI